MATTTIGKAKGPFRSKPKTARVTKKAQLISMLSTKVGADIAAVSKKLGWQNHTTRAALSGLRKAGYDIAAEKFEPGRPTRYRITAAPKNTAGRAETAHAG